MEHIFQFQQKIVLERKNEAMLCKVFSTTLVGSALIWFQQRHEKSIGSFEDFYTLFMWKYRTNRYQIKMMCDLH